MNITIEDFEDLTEEEKNNVPNNGAGKEYANYIRIKHNGETLFLESDAMEPEDAIFIRDLSWIVDAINKCYEIGLAEGKG